MSIDFPSKMPEGFPMPKDIPMPETSPPKVESLRDLPGPHVNKAADDVGDLARAIRRGVEQFIERGIVVEVFGFPIPIRLGPKPKQPQKEQP
jgi:hypothetical protein